MRMCKWFGGWAKLGVPRSLRGEVLASKRMKPAAARVLLCQNKKIVFGPASPARCQTKTCAYSASRDSGKKDQNRAWKCAPSHWLNPRPRRSSKFRWQTTANAQKEGLCLWWVVLHVSRSVRRYFQMGPNDPRRF